VSEQSAEKGPDALENAPWTNAYAVLALFLIALVMFGDLLFQTGDAVVSHRLSDGSHYFARMRDFGFSELAKGNMPLWNPHVFSGTPFVGAFQSGMFYPLNLIYVVLPLDHAMNMDTALHVFLMSLFMFLWARKQGLSVGASFVAGIILAYGGASFVRVLAGHITMLQTLAWAPLILLSIDHVVEKRSNGWMLIGIGATTMQILAGYPPSVLMTAKAAFFYCCVRLVGSEEKFGVIARLIPYGILPPLMACVQLWTGLDTATESMRAAGVSYKFATTYSFPPENLLTFFTPALFGNMVHVMYWGRWAFWDSTAFIGIGGLALVAASVYFGSKSFRRYLGTLLFVFTVLALGSYTPIYAWFFDYIPGFDSFRSPAKFMFPASLFAAMLAGLGADAILQGKVTTKVFSLGSGLLGLICLLCTLWLSVTSIGNEPGETLRSFIDQRAALDDTFFVSLAGTPLPNQYYIQVARVAFVSFLVATITCAVLCFALWPFKTKSWTIYVVPVVAVLEVLAFARLHRPAFELGSHDRPDFDSLYEKDPGDYRIMDVSGIDNAARNHAVDIRKYAIWGYDPVILDRYAQFVVFAAGQRTFDPNLRDIAISGVDPMLVSIHESNYYEFPLSENDPGINLFLALRMRYFIINSGEWNGPSAYWKIGGGLPRFYFSNDYSVHPTQESIFTEMARRDESGKYLFDSTKSILLESEPSPRPAELNDKAELESTVRVLSETTDSIELEISVNQNTLLVVTDSYSKNWRAVPLTKADQERYDVIPVDFTLRGIPLKAGSHHFLLEYAPDSYTIGRWISLASVLFFLVCCVYVGYKGILGSRNSEKSPT